MGLVPPELAWCFGPEADIWQCLNATGSHLESACMSKLWCAFSSSLFPIELQLWALRHPIDERHQRRELRGEFDPGDSSVPLCLDHCRPLPRSRIRNDVRPTCALTSCGCGSLARRIELRKGENMCAPDLKRGLGQEQTSSALRRFMALGVLILLCPKRVVSCYGC